MSGPFTIFDSPAAIEIYLLHRTATTGRDANGILQPETYAAAVRLKASLDRVLGMGQQNKSNVVRDTHNKDGVDVSGEMRLFTSGEKWDGTGSAAIELEDRIRVVFTSRSAGRQTKTYRIRGLVNDYAWIEQFEGGGEGRCEWAIVLEDPPQRPT